MIELAQHIEALLLENDCVIVPNLGGFVAHYSPSTWLKDENTYIPPTRIIGFNPSLKMNDGLLVQSYAAVYGTNFSDATRMVELQVNHLLDVLHKDGKADLPNVGELHYSIYGSFNFIPYDHKLTTPFLYGMDSFAMPLLQTQPSMQTLPNTQPISKKTETKPMLAPLPMPKSTHIPTRRREIRMRLRGSYLSNAVAIVAAVCLFFLFSTPIENTRVVEENYAHLMPSELFAKMGTPSLLFTPVTVNQQKTSMVKKKQSATPIVVKEVKVKPAVKMHEPAENTAKIETTAKTSKTEMMAKSSAAGEKSSAVAKPSPAKPSTAKSTAVKSSTAKTSAAKTSAVKPATVKSEKTVAAKPAASLKYHIIVASVGSEKDAHKLAQQLRAQGYHSARAIIGGGKMRVSIQSCAQQHDAYAALNKIRQHADYQAAWVLKQSLSN